jgi:hypothetical protein
MAEVDAFDLFSNAIVRVDLEKEKREAEARRAERLRREALERMSEPGMYSSVLHTAAIHKALEAFLMFGDSRTPVFRGLDPVREPIPSVKASYHEYLPEMHLGPPPAAKPDQPRHWVAMNQSPRRPDKRR